MLLARAGRADGTDRTRTSSRSSATSTSSATCAWSSGSTTDFAELVARLLRLRHLAAGPVRARCAPRADPVLAAIAAKGVKELTYHRDYAAQWVVRLGDGTDLSHARMQAGAGRAVAAGRRAVRPAPVEPRCPASPPTCVRCAPRSTSSSTPCWPPPGSDRPDAAPLATVARPGRTRRRAHRGAAATCWPSCRASPAPTRTRHGEPAAVTAATAATSPRGARPRTADGHRSPTSASCATVDEDGGRRHRDDHPDLLRLPGDARDQRRPAPPAAAGRAIDEVDRAHRARAAVDQRLDHRRRARASSPRPASRRPHPAAARRRPGPADA